MERETLEKQIIEDCIDRMRESERFLLENGASWRGGTWLSTVLKECTRTKLDLLQLEKAPSLSGAWQAKPLPGNAPSQGENA